MIAAHKIIEAEKLLKRGNLSQRSIAKITGLSRGTIGNLAGGKRHVYEKTMEPDMPKETENMPPVRCPGCGGMVRMPCLLCFVAQRSRKKRAKNIDPPVMTETQPSSQPSPAFGVTLVGEELKRYREIRAWRENHTNPYFNDIPEDWPWRKKR